MPSSREPHDPPTYATWNWVWARLRCGAKMRSMSPSRGARAAAPAALFALLIGLVAVPALSETGVASLESMSASPGSATPAGWLTPVRLSPPGIPAGNSSIVVDAAGNATAFWVVVPGVSAGPEGLMFARRLAGETTWTEPVFADARATGDWSDEVLAAPSGAVTSLHRRWAGGSRLWTVTMAADGTLEPPMRLSAAGTTAPSFDLAADRAGNLTAAWVERLPGKYWRVAIARRPVDGEWSRPRFLSRLSYAARWVQIDVAPTGEALVAWAAHRIGVPDRTRLHVRSFVPGSGWSPSAVLTPKNQDVYDFAVLAGRGGFGRIAWNLVRSNRFGTAIPNKLWLSSRRRDGTWVGPIRVPARTAVNFVPQFVRGPGRIALTWASYRGPRDAGLLVRVREHGHTWSATRRYTARAGYVEPGRAAFAQDGRLVLAWSYKRRNNSDSEFYAVQTRARAANGTWSPIVALTGFRTSSLSRQGLAVDPAGKAHVTWRTINGAFLSQER